LILTGLAKRRGGHHTYVTVPGRIKLVIYTEMSAYLNAAMPLILGSCPHETAKIKGQNGINLLYFG